MGGSGELGFFEPWSRIREYRPGFLILRMIKIEEMEKNSISKLLLEKKNVFFYVGSRIRILFSGQSWIRKKSTRLCNSDL